MKILLMIAMIASLGTPAALEAAKHESPFACDRAALTAEKRKRHFDELSPALRLLRKSTHELADGFEFEFPADAATYQLLAEWVGGERLCCPFFDIAMTFGSEGGPFWLTLTGRPGTKEFIKVDAPDWIK